MAARYGYKSKKSILDILRKHNIPIRNYNEIQRNSTTYSNLDLSEITTPEFAYCIGLLITDGYIVQTKDSTCIGIDLTDYDAISLVSKVLKSKIKIIKSKNPKHLTKYRVTIYGKRFLKDLERYGVVPRKTFTTKGPKLLPQEEQYLHYIIRGIIDGDGWIRKDGKEFFISTASENFADWCFNSLTKLGFTDLNYHKIANEYNGYFEIRSGKKHNLNLLKTMYLEKLGMNTKRNKLLGDVQRL